MRYKSWNDNENSSAYSYSSTTFDDTFVINNELISSLENDTILLWLDESINKGDKDDRHSISQLHQVFNSAIYTFTNKEVCLNFINNFMYEKKLFLIISGSLGKEIVPQIENLLQINSVYIFCGKKINHECWAKKFSKISGVFDDIADVCEYLERDKHKLKQDHSLQRFFGSLSEKSFSYRVNQIDDLKKPYVKYDDHQPNEDTRIIVTSADIPFSKEESCLPNEEENVGDNIQSTIHPSDTVTPFVQYKQQMEFSDNGQWPSISVIDSTRNGIFKHLHTVIGTVNYSHSVENCLQHVDNHRTDPHFIVLGNPTNIECLPALMYRPYVRKVYIYCFNDKFNEYRLLSENFPNIVSVLQHIDTLTRLIVWNLSACIVEIGNQYDSVNKKSLAQARYRYAYRLHTNIKLDLTNRIEVIQCNRFTDSSN